MINGKTFDNDRTDEILKTPLCLNYNSDKGICNLILLIRDNQVFYVSLKDVSEKCIGHCSKNKCCYYKPYQMIFRKRNPKGNLIGGA